MCPVYSVNYVTGLYITFTPPVGERSSLLWFPSPLWREGAGEGGTMEFRHRERRQGVCKEGRTVKIGRRVIGLPAAIALCMALGGWARPMTRTMKGLVFLMLAALQEIVWGTGLSVMVVSES